MLTLDARKAVYWKEAASLFIADLHLGKISHFRKAGIGIPTAAARMNLLALESLFIDYQPILCYFLGDLFHSAANEEWFHFQTLCRKYGHIHFHLITGNHDNKLLKYLKNNQGDWLITSDNLTCPPFFLTHQPEDRMASEKIKIAQDHLFRLCGHFHPKVKLSGLGKQQVSMPCFHFSKNQGILPSFGQFTGGSYIKPEEGDQIFGVINDNIYPMMLPS
jgi:DNA ligase-associated metallophosphoesterase